MDINKILLKFLNDKASQEELDLLEKWKSESTENLNELKEIIAINNAANGMKHYKEFNVEKALSKVDDKTLSTEYVNRKFRSYVKFGLIIIAIITILSAIYYLSISNNNQPEIYYAENSISDINLIDNSSVTLDKNSQLIAHRHFEENRHVTLEGRAFFNVEHLASEQNFTVTIPGAEIVVLGTKFSVSSYDNLKEIAVFEGTVAVKVDNRTVTINSGEKIKLLHNDILKLQFDNPNYLSWLNGKMTYEHTPINNVLKDLEWNFLTSINIPDELNMSDCRVTTTFNNLSLEAIFQELAFTTKITYDNTGQEINVKSIKCY